MSRTTEGFFANLENKLSNLLCMEATSTVHLVLFEQDITVIYMRENCEFVILVNIHGVACAGFSCAAIA